MIDPNIIAALPRDRDLRQSGDWITNGAYAALAAPPAGVEVEPDFATLAKFVATVTRDSGALLLVELARLEPIPDTRVHCQPCLGSGETVCPTCGHDDCCAACDGTGYKPGVGDRGRDGWVVLHDDLGEVAIDGRYAPLLTVGSAWRVVIAPENADVSTWIGRRYAIGICDSDGAIVAIIMPLSSLPEEYER